MTTTAEGDLNGFPNLHLIQDAIRVLRGSRTAGQAPRPPERSLQPKFNTAGLKSVMVVQETVKRISDHLRLCTPGLITVSFVGDSEAPASVQREGNDFFIEVRSEFSLNLGAIQALLAHEMMHVYLSEY